MVKKQMFIAVSAGIVSSAPVLSPTWPVSSRSADLGLGGLLGGVGNLVGGLLGGGSTTTVIPITSSAGWNWNSAGVLQAALGGASAGAIDPNSLQAFYYWVQHSGSNYFPSEISQHFSSWCTGDPSATIPTSSINTVSGLLINLNALGNLGGLTSFLNGLLSSGAGNNCACSTVDPSVLNTLQLFIGSSQFQTLDPVVAGTLSTCHSGGYSQILSSPAHSRCHHWLHSHHCHFSQSEIDAIEAWLNGHSYLPKRSALTTIINNIPPVYLASGNQLILGNFFNSTSFTTLDPNIQGLLHVCAVGGLISSVDPSAVTLFLGWLHATANPLSPGLVTALINWATGTVGTGVMTLPAAPVLDYTTLASSVAGYLTGAGSLTGAGQSLLTSFIHSLPSLPADPSSNGSTGGGGGQTNPGGSTGTGGLGGLTGTAGGLTGTAGSLPGAVAGTVGGVVGGVAGTVAGTAGGLVGGVLGTASGLLGGASGAAGGITGTAGGLLGGVTGAAGSTPGAAGGVVGGATGSAGGVLGGVTGTAGGVLGGVTGTAGGVLGGVTGGAGGVPGTVGGIVGGVTGGGLPNVPVDPSLPVTPGVPTVPTVGLPTIPNVTGIISGVPLNGLTSGIVFALTSAATGGLASALNAAETSLLASYLTTNALTIPPTINALVLSWISQAIVNPPAISTVFGASISGGAAYTIPTAVLGSILAAASGASITPLLASAFALAGSGIPVYYLSPTATAGLASFLVGTSSNAVSSNVQHYLTQWLVGVAIPGL